MFVLTVDQRHSRTSDDQVPQLLTQFTDAALVRSFDRTAGDEVQAVSDDAATVADIIIAIAQLDAWSIGIGVGDVEEPLARVTRAGRGPAFEYAREAVTHAKRAPGHVSVRGENAAAAADTTAVLALLFVIIERRTSEGHDVVARVRSGVPQNQIAVDLGISKQAVSQRLSVAQWAVETPARDVIIRMLEAVAA